jgi:hypothetical protein
MRPVARADSYAGCQADRVLGTDHSETLRTRNNRADAYQGARRAGCGHPATASKSPPAATWASTLVQTSIKGARMKLGRMLARSAARSARRTAVHTATTPVRIVTPRPVRQAMHPVSTVRRAATPRPVRQVTRAAWTVQHPVRAAIQPRRRKRGLFAWLTGGSPGRREEIHRAKIKARVQQQGQEAMAERARLAALAPSAGGYTRAPARPPTPPAAQQRQPAQPAPAPRQRAQRWPADRGFRTPPPDVTPKPQPMRPPQSAGEWELQARRSSGLGDGRHGE